MLFHFEQDYAPLKYPLQPGRNVLEIPGGMGSAKLMFQRGVPTLWVSAKAEEREKETIVFLVGTGRQVPGFAAFLDSAISEDGSYVLHAYLIKE